MCLVFAAFTEQSDCRLRIFFNRDEHFERPTAPLSYWEDAPHIMGGRDLERGGTWAAARHDGMFACVTFVREPYADSLRRRSRGHLVTDFLLGVESPEDFAAGLVKRQTEFWGYNMLLGNKDRLYHYSTRSKQVVELDSGVHGVSNACLNTPWPKVVKGKQRLEALLKQGGLTSEQALHCMSDKEVAPDDQLPNSCRTIERERSLSPMFIDMPNYGTRSTAFIEFDQNCGVTFTEWTHDSSGQALKRKLEFSYPPSQTQWL